MPIYAKKTKLGYYKELPEASEWSLATTHVILTWTEFMDYKDYIGKLKTKMQDIKDQSEHNLFEAEQEYKDRYLHLKKNLEEEHKKNDNKEWLRHQEEIQELKDLIKERDQKIDGLERKLSDLDEQVEIQKDQNRSFLRVAKERGNAERGVTPKKAHHGYLLLGSIQAIDRIQIPDPHDAWNTIAESKIVWKTTLQTPYPILLDIHSMATSIQAELFDTVLPEMGVSTSIRPVNGSYPLDARDCVAYRWMYRASAKSGYWETEVWTTDPVIILERNLPPQSAPRKWKGGEKNDSNSSSRKEETTNI